MLGPNGSHPPEGSPMPIHCLPWLIVPKAPVQLLELILLPVITIRGHRGPVRIGRAIAGLVIQE